MVLVSYPVHVGPNSPFGLFNLPFGIFSTSTGVGLESRPRAGVAIGDFVLELHQLAKYGLLEVEAASPGRLEEIFLEPVLNDFASLPSDARTQIRATIIKSLSDPNSLLWTKEELNEAAFVQIEKSCMHLPMKITDYTDSFSSLVHAQNCLHPLGLEIPEAFTEYPMGYNGRLSSIKTSGVNVHRPCGLFPSEGAKRPTFQPTRQLDFEVELGAFLSKPIKWGSSINAKEAADYIFGYVLLNDWSARDLQKYEMPPLGPFHSKGFVTTISPWIVTLDALKSCRASPPTSSRMDIHPNLITDGTNHGVYEIELQAHVTRGDDPPVEIVRTNYADSYWSIPQMIAYQSSTGLGLHVGDLVGSGTISSPGEPAPGTRAANGCLLEVFAVGHALPNVGGKSMSWLEDGDKFEIEGWFKTEDGSRCGFGGVSSIGLTP